MEEQPTSLTKHERRKLRQEAELEKQKKRAKIQRFKKIAIWFFITLGIGGIIIGIAKPGSSPSSVALPLNSISESDRMKGNKEADIVLIEYSDFQCPACGAYYPVVKQLAEEFSGKIKFVYRHFPLRQIHPNAELAAQASEAAGKQGKFWEMHNIIFENQKEWSNESKAKEFFVRYAETLGLNKEQFNNEINSKEIKDKINGDYQSGLRLNVNATPTFFLNGEKLQNPRNYEDFKSQIQRIINQQ